MRIFSLQSKTALVMWSVVLGLVLFAFSMLIHSYLPGQTAHCDNFVSPEGFPMPCPDWVSAPQYFQGWPIGIQYGSGYDPQINSKESIAFGFGQLALGNIVAVIDFVFWILASFVILLTIRHFRKKKYQISAKQP